MVQGLRFDELGLLALLASGGLLLGVLVSTIPRFDAYLDARGWGSGLPSWYMTMMVWLVALVASMSFVVLAGVVLAQMRAKPVVRGGARPDGVLLSAGEHRDGVGELGVGGQRPVRVGVGAQDVGEHDRVAVVGLAARSSVASTSPTRSTKARSVVRKYQAAQFALGIGAKAPSTNSITR
jgi:hypothetical protein